MTHYAKLGVPQDASVSDIKKAYKAKALELHPDKHPEEERDRWHEEFKILQEVWETLGNEQSRKVYDEKYVKFERTVRVLVLMDMNGSLLCKIKKRESLFGMRSHACMPHFEDREHYFFLRPGVQDFLEKLLDKNSNIAFAIYTSRQAHNAGPQVEQLFRAVGRPELQKQLFAVFAGSAYSLPDPESGPYKWMRSLPKIWSDFRTCAASGVKFDKCNTVNLDNQASALRNHMANGILVPTYDETKLSFTDEALSVLGKYLLRLAKESHGDVREYMRLFPFSSNGRAPIRALPPVDDFMDGDDDEVQERVFSQSRVHSRSPRRAAPAPFTPPKERQMLPSAEPPSARQKDCGKQ